jgi:glucosamine--fructose-6-phosphate aminotransferase (isomerizing)
MQQKGTYTQEEILSQPEAWAAALQVLDERRQEILQLYTDHPPDQILFTGCGSTYYLSLAAAALTQELTGQPTRGLPASELWLYPASSYPWDARTLLVAVSRSGATTETLRACQAFKEGGRGVLLTISCYADKPLAASGDLNLVLPSGAERSVAQTRAFSSLYLATVALAASWGEQRGVYDELAALPPACRRLLESYADLANSLGRESRFERFYFLGSGPRYGLACELSLKMKEMSLSHSEPFHFMEFRHGPKSMVNPETLVVGLVSEQNAAEENKVLEEMQTLGAQVFTMGEASGSVVFHSGLVEAARNSLYLPIGQLLAFERAISKGLDPDLPENLQAVIQL